MQFIDYDIGGLVLPKWQVYCQNGKCIAKMASYTSADIYAF